EVARRGQGAHRQLHFPHRRQARRLSDDVLSSRSPARGRTRSRPRHRAADGLHDRRAAAVQLKSRCRRQPDHPEKLMSTAPLRQPITKPDRIDPITTSVIQGALENIAVEMGYKLMRMSYSSIIRESED